MGSSNLRKLQVGPETTKGTAVSAAKILVGLDGQIKDTSNLDERQLTYYQGLMTGATTAPIFLTDTAEVALTGDLTFENAPYIFSAGWKSISPVTGAGSAVWAFPPPTTSLNSPKTFTIQTGDDTEQLKATYGFIDSFEIQGKSNEVLTTKGKFLGRSVSAAVTGFDTATALGATQIPFNLCRLYVDTTGTAFGTTAVTGTLREYTLKVDPGFHFKNFSDGTLAPTSDGQDRPKVTLDVVVEYNSSATGIRANWKAKTAQNIRFISASATSVNPSVYFDTAGYWDMVDSISDAAGNTVVKASFIASPVSTANSGYVQFNVLNAATGGL